MLKFSNDSGIMKGTWDGIGPTLGPGPCPTVPSPNPGPLMLCVNKP